MSLFHNPSPQPPPRSGEGEKDKRARSGSPSPLRGGGWGEGLWNRLLSAKIRAPIRVRSPRASLLLLGLEAVVGGPLGVALRLVVVGQGGVGRPVARVLLEGAEQPAAADVLVTHAEQQLAQLAVEGRVVRSLRHPARGQLRHFLGLFL